MKRRLSRPSVGARALVLVIAVVAASAPVRAAIPNSERQVLIDLYNATNGAAWTDSTGWNGASGTECSWFGVTCDGAETTVTWLNLYNNNVVGALPASIGGFSGLQALWLHNNQLSGPIPAEIGDLTNLQKLNLGGNQLDGSLPASLGDLVNLVELYLYSNQLTGNLPASLGSLASLQFFNLQTNQVSGAIPTEFGALSNLIELNFAVNQLTGPIPASLGNLSNLQKLYLQSNKVLAGPIPASLGNLSSLTYLNLGDNLLTGPIPPEFGNLTQLTFMSLDSNQLSGALPATLGNLVNLQHLFVASNRIIGAIPDSYLSLAGLQVGMLDMRWNGVWTATPALATFLASVQVDGDWEGTQTIAPVGVAAAPSSTSVTVSWTPIVYTADSGGYRVSYGIVSGGPYTFFGRTADKNASSLEITGLVSGTTYYCIVESETDPHGHQHNTVTSPPSVEISVSTSGGGQQGASQQVISLIANLDGQLGSHWMSDVKITNPFSQPITVVLQGTPHDTSASAGDPTLTRTLQPRETVGIEDVYGALFGGQAQDKARLLITTTDSQGEGIGAPIVTSNIYNAAGAGGEFQTYGPPIEAADFSQAGSVVGDNTVKGPGERYNFDVTTGAGGATICYTYRDSVGGDERITTESYKPDATRQHVDAQQLFGLSAFAPNSSIVAEIQAGAAFIRGTPTNNITSDSRSQPWQEVVDSLQKSGTAGPGAAATGKAKGEQIISLIANLDGALGSHWMSDVKITNPFSQAIMVVLQGTPHDASASAADPTLTRTLQPGETVGIEDVYGALFGGKAQGKARLVITTTDIARVKFAIPITTSNIYNVAGAGGEFQTYGPPVQSGRLYKAGATLGDNTVKGSGERYNFDVTTGPAGATIRYSYRDSLGGDGRITTESYTPNATRQHVNAQKLFGLSAFAPNSSIVAEIQVGAAFIRGTPTNNITSDSRSQPWRQVGSSGP